MTDTRLQRQPDIRVGVLPDGHVLLHLDKVGWVHVLTPMGGLVWEFCDGKNTAEEIVDIIFQLDGIQMTPALKENVFALIAELRKLGLLIPVDSA